MRNRPARGGGPKPQAALQFKVIDLIDHPVDIIAQRRALFFDPVVMGNHGGGSVAGHHQVIHHKTQRTQPGNRV